MGVPDGRCKIPLLLSWFAVGEVSFVFYCARWGSNYYIVVSAFLVGFVGYASYLIFFFLPFGLSLLTVM